MCMSAAQDLGAGDEHKSASHVILQDQVLDCDQGKSTIINTSPFHPTLLPSMELCHALFPVQSLIKKNLKCTK